MSKQLGFLKLNKLHAWVRKLKVHARGLEIVVCEPVKRELVVG